VFDESKIPASVTLAAKVAPRHHELRALQQY
jgi:hypothetical protein